MATKEARTSTGSTSAVSTAPPVDDLKGAQLPPRPWRKSQYILPWERLAAEKWEGEGTEESPYIVGWLHEDPENPQNWTVPYRCKFQSSFSIHLHL
jgi:hypothetical protein